MKKPVVNQSSPLSLRVLLVSRFVVRILDRGSLRDHLSRLAAAVGPHGLRVTTTASPDDGEDVPVVWTRSRLTAQELSEVLRQSGLSAAVTAL